ncbi:hypothetical protein [Ectopseudomonas khazarica]|uniref:hypothetical protein n=1 Tax=Ectopseudomonas khazarica TaxID=2502979 RepID=UPI0037C50B9B
MKNIAVVLAGALACLWSAIAVSSSWEVFEQRLQMIPPDVQGNDDPLDVREILPAFKRNPAKAGLKYGKPTVYEGVVKRVVVSNQSDADLIVDAGNGDEITVVLYPVQPSAWKKDEKGEWKFMELESTMEFAANLEGGERFYLQCRKFVTSFGRHYLSDCLAFPPKAFD